MGKPCHCINFSATMNKLCSIHQPVFAYCPETIMFALTIIQIAFLCTTINSKLYA